MNGGFIPAANLHSPGPIGDVTPGTIAGTSVAVGTMVFTSNGFNIILTGGGFAFGNSVIYNNGTGNNTLNLQDGFGNGVNIPNGIFRITGIPTSASGRASGDIYSNAGILTIVP